MQTPWLCGLEQPAFPSFSVHGEFTVSREFKDRRLREVMHANVLPACDNPVSDLEMVALFLRRHSELTHQVWEEGWEKRVRTVKNHILAMCTEGHILLNILLCLSSFAFPSQSQPCIYHNPSHLYTFPMSILSPNHTQLYLIPYQAPFI